MKLVMNPIERILRDKGLAERGAVQRFHTANVLRRIIRYMPYRTSTLTKLTIAQTDINSRFITTIAPQAKFLYYGKLMVGIRSGSAWAHRNEPKKVTGKALNYTKTKNPNAGPFWDRALKTAEGTAIQADLQRYIRTRR